jgi:hypothetical protein
VLEPEPKLEYHSTPSLYKFSFSTHIIYIPFQKCTMQIIVFWHVATFTWSEQHCSIPGTCDIGLCALCRWNHVWFLKPDQVWNSFEKHRYPRFRNLESISDNFNKEFHHSQNLVETGTYSFLENQELKPKVFLKTKNGTCDM